MFQPSEQIMSKLMLLVEDGQFLFLREGVGVGWGGGEYTNTEPSQLCIRIKNRMSDVKICVFPIKVVRC